MTQNEVRAEIVRMVTESVAAANMKWKIGMQPPEVGFYGKGVCAGRAYQFRNRVEFNEVLARENINEFHQTVKHEIAHLVTWKICTRAKQNHGPEFKSVLSNLGGKPTTYHSYDVSAVKRKVRRAIYSCACSSSLEVSMQQHHRISKPNGRATCNRCHVQVTFTGKVIVK